MKLTEYGGQVLAQHDGDYDDDIYLYLHDRLGSVRQVIDPSGDVKNRYTYQPLGKKLALRNRTEC